MNKNLLFGMVAATGMLLATSCTNDELDGVRSGNECVVSFTLEQPSISTRAYSDGLTANTLTYAVYESGEAEALITSEDEVAFSNKTATVNLRLVTGKSYDILFWADAKESPYTFNAATQTVTVDYASAASNDEKRDAFFAAEKGLTVDGAINKTITLQRPFAQLNIGATDMEEAAAAGFTPKQSSVTVKNVYNSLNLLSGEVSDAAEVTYALAAIPEESETFPVADAKYLAMNYLLVGSEKELADVEFTVSDGSLSIDRSYASVPVQRNYRTNIYGKILTLPADFTIKIDQEYNQPDNNVVVWDGKTVTEPESNDTEWIVSTAAEWVWLKSKGTQGKNIKLDADLDFGGYEVKGLGFTGEFDGQKHTMSNLTLLCGGSYYSNGLFQGDASGNVTVKNVSIENVNAECSAEDQGYVGVIFGDVQNDVTLENVHVKNATLRGVQSVGGLVGFVASGKTLTVNNCSVDGSNISNYPVANESGYVAGMVGRPVGTVTITNYTVTNTVINGYYALLRGERSIQPVVGGKAELTAGPDVIVTKTSLTGMKFVTDADELAEALTADAASISVILNADIDLPISSLGQQTGGSGEYKLGGENTQSILIDLNGKKLNLTTTYMSSIGAKNADATMTIKNGTMTSSTTSGTWNIYDLTFANCNYVINDVVFEKAIAFTNTGKTATIKNVTVNETNDYYAIWISAVGQIVTIDGLTVKSGRGIKIDEEYVGEEVAKVILNISNAKFITPKKAAIMVKSIEGAEINVSNIDISEVARDKTNAVWVDGDSREYADKVIVNGASKEIEPLLG